MTYAYDDKTILYGVRLVHRFNSIKRNLRPRTPEEMGLSRDAMKTLQRLRYIDSSYRLAEKGNLLIAEKGPFKYGD